MPQMSPLSWLTLMYFFLILMFLTNLMVYNSFFKFLDLNKSHNYNLYYNWKW